MNAERALWVRGVHEGPWSALGVHVAHFRPMCLTAWNSPRHPTSPIMSRTGPTGFDVWSSRGGRPERTLGEHPHVLGGRVVSRKGVNLMPFMPHPHAPAHSRVRGEKRVVRAGMDSFRFHPAKFQLPLVVLVRVGILHAHHFSRFQNLKNPSTSYEADCRDLTSLCLRLCIVESN